MEKKGLDISCPIKIIHPVERDRLISFQNLSHTRTPQNISTYLSLTGLLVLLWALSVLLVPEFDLCVIDDSRRKGTAFSLLVDGTFWLAFASVWFWLESVGFWLVLGSF